MNIWGAFRVTYDRQGDRQKAKLLARFFQIIFPKKRTYTDWLYALKKIR